MNRLQFLKPESTNFSELQKQLELQMIQLKSIILDAYLKGRNDGFELAISGYSTGQIYDGSSTEQRSSIYGESSNPQSPVPTNSKDPQE